MADATSQALEDVVLPTIWSNLPPLIEDLPPERRHVVTDRQSFNDADLWAVAREPVPPPQWRRHQRRLRKAHTGALTAAEQQALTRLRGATARFVIRRSYALALFKWREHTIPPDV
jgi:hypothetical protein